MFGKVNLLEKQIPVIEMNLNELTYGVDFNKFPEDCRVICICSHGLRSARAA
jgi:rhodanese-related sulfurtransferase